MSSGALADAFERGATRYEAWYDTPDGRRADVAERRILEWLLSKCPPAQRVLEIGCGTGHFTRWLAGSHELAAGLDASVPMLAEAQRRHPGLPLVRGDARHLPLRSVSVDVVVFVTTLEFLEEPAPALREAVRVTRRGLVVLALNRWSVGGVSRRFGKARHSPIRSRARDLSILSLRRQIHVAARMRLDSLVWTSGLFPDGLWRKRAPLPLGDVIGAAAVLR